MGVKRQNGYTIVEVTLFLAISGLLFMVAIIGTGGVMRTVRFNDSARSLMAFLQKQYDDVSSGVNTRTSNLSCAGGVVSGSAPSQPVGASNCMLIGKLVVLRQNSAQVRTYNIVGVEPPNLDLSRTDVQLIDDYDARAATGQSPTVYDIPWQAHVTGMKRLDAAAPPAANVFALIRSPRSTRVVTFSYKDPNDPPLADIDAFVRNSTTYGKTTNVCVKDIENISRPVRFSIADKANQGAVQLTFDASDGDCNGI